MYAPFFGLRHEPFSIAPDPRYLFMSERHREALAHLMYGLSCGGGIVMLTGGVGTGKTTLCRSFLEQVPAHCNVAYVFNPRLSAIELLQTICEEFHVPLPAPAGGALTVRDCLEPLYAFLLQAHAQGRNNLLVIDEAQNLAPDVLEQLRLLTNLETPSRKLLQVVLVGQPELREIVSRPQLEQLAQRVVARYHLTALDARETAHYVRHRLEVAGLARALPFERRALRHVWRASHGIPRRINLLCDRCLLGAYAAGRDRITLGAVRDAAREVFAGAPAPWRWRPRPLRWRDWPALVLPVGLAASASALLLAGAWWAVSPGGTLAGPRQALAEPGIARASGPFPLLVSWLGSPVGRGGTAQPAVPATAREDGAAVIAASPRMREAAVSMSALLLRDLDVGWRELASEWKVQLPRRGDPCVALAAEQLQCLTQSLGLSTIRLLGRPGILTLDAATAQPSYALLVGLTDDSATLRAGGVEQTVTLRALAARWQGEFSTLWRAPPGYTGRAADRERGPAVAWAANQLALGEPGARPEEVITQERSLRARLRHFQLAQGLPVTGTLTPLTFMQLNRAAGLDEPRLRTHP